MRRSGCRLSGITVGKPWKAGSARNVPGDSPCAPALLDPGDTRSYLED